LRSFDGLGGNLLGSMEVSVVLARATAEGAELATDKANVCEINIAVYDVSNDVADHLAPQLISGHQEAEEVVTVGVGDRNSFFAGQSSAILCD
jgi:hypothetical protein